MLSFFLTEETSSLFPAKKAHNSHLTLDPTGRAQYGDARHRRLVAPRVCRVEIDHISLRRVILVFANKAVPSPYARAFGFAPAVA